MTKEEIDEKVKNNKCPTWDSFCTVATTGYPKDERERTCTRCWKEYIEEEQLRKRKK